MKYKAKVSFCGIPVSMHINEIREFPKEIDSKAISDLLQAGLIEKVKEEDSGTRETLPDTAAETVKVKKAKTAQ